MLLTFLHAECRVPDTMLFGRFIECQASRNRASIEETFHDVHSIESRCDIVSSLIRTMDKLTDPKMIREALAYRPILVN